MPQFLDGSLWSHPTRGQARFPLLAASSAILIVAIGAVLMITRVASEMASVGEAAEEMRSIGHILDELRAEHEGPEVDLGTLMAEHTLPLAASALLTDPWGRPYVLRPEGRTGWSIRSLGRDGLPDTQDDLWIRCRSAEGWEMSWEEAPGN